MPSNSKFAIQQSDDPPATDQEYSDEPTPKPDEVEGSGESRREDSHQFRCGKCGANTVVTEQGETFCESCGVVIEDLPVDETPQQVETHAGEQRLANEPVVRMRSDRGLGTRVGTDRAVDRDPGIAARKRPRLKRQHQLHTQEDSGKETVKYGYGEVSRLCSALDVGQPIKRKARALFKKIVTEDLAKGRSLDGLATAAVYATIRCEPDICRPKQEIISHARCDEPDLERAFSTVNQEFGLPVKWQAPIDFIPPIRNALELPPSAAHDARELAKAASSNSQFVGCAPSGVAGACVYFATRETAPDISQRQIADIEALDTTYRTIQRRFADLCEFVGEPPLEDAWRQCE